jgi:hypothetical protein
VYTKLDQQLKIMGSELTNIRDYQEIVTNKCGYSKKDGRSKTSTVVYKPALSMLPFYSVSNNNENPTLSFQMGAKTHHTIHAEMINSGINYNSLMSIVPNNRATVWNNPLDLSKNKQSLKVIHTSPHICGSIQVDKHTYERELLFSPQLSELSIYRNAYNQNTMDVGQSSSDTCSDYLQQIFIKIDTDISPVCKFLVNFNNAVNSQFVLDSASNKAHTVLCLSNIPGVSASEDHCAQSETSGRLADKIRVISNYHNDLVQNRVSKLISNTNLSTTQQIKFLQTVNILWSALPTSPHNKEVSLCTSHTSCFNTPYSWQEGDRSRVLGTYNAISKNSQIQADCIINGNSDSLQNHSSTFGDCTSFIECNGEVNFIEGCEISDYRKVIHEDNVPFKPGVVLQKHAVTTESEVSASLEQHSFETDGSEPSDLTRQKKLMDVDSLYDLHDFIREGTDKIVTSSRGHPIIMSQKMSLSQPTLPTYLLHNSTDDEQLSEDDEDGSDNLSDTFTASEDIHHENISKLMGHLSEDPKENKQLEMPYNAINVVSHETTEETESADINQNVYTTQLDHLNTNLDTELKINVSFSELCNKSQKLHMKNDGFHEENKLSYPSSSDMDTKNNDHEVPFVIIQDMNTWYREDGNALEMESHISQSITGTEAHLSKREYPRKSKQHLLFPLSQNEIFSVDKVISDGNIQCEACNLPNISSWNRPENKTCRGGVKTSHSHVTLSACSNCARDEYIQCKVCALTLPRDTDTNKRQMDKTTSHKHKPEVEICHLTEVDSRIYSKYESCMIRDNISSPEYITTQRAQMSTRPDSPDMCSNDFSHQHLPGQNHTVFPNSDPESLSNSWEDNYYQTQPMPHPCTQNRNQMSQVHDSPENTLHSCIDMAIKKYENDIHKQPCYTEVKPTRDVTVQTNIKSLINLENQNYCFVCFSNNNQYNNKNFKDGTHQHLALKRHIEALCLESVSLHKKRRYDTLKSIESNSRSEKSEIIEGFSSDDVNEDINFKYEEYLSKVQVTSIINGENSVESDHKVPDVGKDISWMEDDMDQRELYMTDQITKGKLTSLYNSA